MMEVDIIDLSSDEETEAAAAEDVKPIIQVCISNEQLTQSSTKVLDCRVAVCQDELKISKLVDSEVTVAKKFSHERLLSSSVVSTLPNEPCRQFWKAGDCESGQGLQSVLLDGKNRLRVHPKFLHSNATSHKWVFGAVAELLDNAVDEIKNGATFVILDVVSNFQNGNPTLLIQDDGAGMNPDSLRRCMSFGFSDKDVTSSIGQYGNGFKTSTMRLGADVIVFSRHVGKDGKSTQSVGLLSYTFLRATGMDDIVVPMVDYEVSFSGVLNKRLYRRGEHYFFANLDTILKWSLFGTEDELLKQFDDIGPHGTKIFIFNLWSNDDGVLELDFDSDENDILISGAPKVLGMHMSKKLSMTQNHIANRLRFSLRAYLSILYLHLPECFRIILRGGVVQHHKLVNDLRYVECIKYTPNIVGNKEAVFITTIGFLEGAPTLNIQGFSVYHKNRLILPFWRVINSTNSKGRGVAGVLEADFIKPTHDKQNFEKSALYYRLEYRLKEMTSEYWNYHCHLIGYPIRKISSEPGRQPTSKQFIDFASHAGKSSQTCSSSFAGSSIIMNPGLQEKRGHSYQEGLCGPVNKQARLSTCTDSFCRPQGLNVRQTRQGVLLLIRENEALLSDCMELEKMEMELKFKVEALQKELDEEMRSCVQLVAELRTFKDL